MVPVGENPCFVCELKLQNSRSRSKNADLLGK